MHMHQENEVRAPLLPLWKSTEPAIEVLPQGVTSGTTRPTKSRHRSRNAWRTTEAR